MLLGRLIFSVVITAAAGGTYWLSNAITMWLMPLSGGVG